MVATAKLASTFILFGLSVLSGVISCITVKCLVLKLGTSTKFTGAISLLNCFSGGVFFATSVLSLLPEARESMEHALEGFEYSSEYPFTELAMCIGFFMILMLEHIAHKCCSSNTTTRPIRPENDPRSKERNSMSESARADMTVGYRRVSGKRYNGLNTKDPIQVASDLEDSSYHDDMTYQTYGAVDESVDSPSNRPYSEVRNDSANSKMREVVFQDSDRILIRNAKVPKEVKIKSTNEALTEVRDSADDNRDPTRSRLRGLVLLIALSLHMIFDGLALGLLKDDSKVYELLAALCLHKVLVFFTIGVQTLELLASVKKTICVIVVFALMSPCGVIIGESINLSGESEAKDLSSAILQGFATGTFLFVTFFEILQRELGSGDHDIFKVFTTIFGFALIACTRLLEHEE
ncbi:zinc transporter ZIP1-like [Ruditapes philippinarum]|uniref:zinc transporter ZIP1-like n=1 Tax=Ruditapes philippinarum TaxID=129788 RepID=UPI00295BC37B|nr:zinc transporter ZIP1-like [Ruditapes philippinarum]